MEDHLVFRSNAPHLGCIVAIQMLLTRLELHNVADEVGVAHNVSNGLIVKENVIFLTTSLTNEWLYICVCNFTPHLTPSVVVSPILEENQVNAIKLLTWQVTLEGCSCSS